MQQLPVAWTLEHKQPDFHPNYTPCGRHTVASSVCWATLKYLHTCVRCIFNTSSTTHITVLSVLRQHLASLALSSSSSCLGTGRSLLPSGDREKIKTTDKQTREKISVKFDWKWTQRKLTWATWKMLRLKEYRPSSVMSEWFPPVKKLFIYSYYYYSITLVSKEPSQYFEKNINAKIHVNSEHEK